MTDSDKLRKAQLKIAKEIRRICEKHGICFFLDCGSMLGAVRHQGFIPWDDDMDIGMLDGDYQKFLRVAPAELSEEFFLDNSATNPENGLVFSKIRLKGTRYIENKSNPQAVHSEIFVDIFPYYFISDRESARKLEGMAMAVLCQAILSKSGFKVWKGENRLKRLKFIPTDILGALVPMKTLRGWVDGLYHKHRDTGRVCIHSGSCYDYWFFPVELFDEMIEMPFEGILFPVPKRYDEFLRTAYGPDYMTPPPPEKRITHQIQLLDLGPFDDKQ